MLGGDDHHCVEHFLEWLGRISPCMFARMFASHPDTKQTRIVCSVVLDEFSAADALDVDHAFDDAAKKGWFGLVLFPRLRTAEGLAEVLSTLVTSPRWDCQRVEWRKVERPTDRPIGLTWMTASGLVSSAMGFAPLGSMPVTRRSPYYAIVAWPGGRANTLMHSSRRDAVGFIDGAHGLEESAYNKAFAGTTSRVGRLFGDPIEDRVLLRDVGFCLPATLADEFLADHAPAAG